METRQFDAADVGKQQGSSQCELRKVMVDECNSTEDMQC
jgi:hypothetical protein